MKSSLTLQNSLIWFLLAPALILGTSATAQGLLRQYRTAEYIEYIKQTYTNASTEQANLEKHHSQNYFTDDIKPATLPLVFHVLYSEESEKVLYERILRQIDDLNRDFGMTDPVQDHINDPDDIYFSKAANTLIQFCLAAETPEHKATTGVNYIPVSTRMYDGFTQMKSKQTGTEAWNTERYINIWICHLPDDNSGFAQMPFGPREYDGIVIDYRYVSNPEFVPFDQGKTLTHLMGNYLNLHPLWGFKRCGDDYVDDTPIHNDINYGCPQDNHITACSGNALEMTMNFMDNTDDACIYMFTKGQMIRMQNMILNKGVRHALTWTPVQCDLNYDEAAEIRTDDRDLSSEEFNAEIYPIPLNNLMNIRLAGSDDSLPTKIRLINSLGETVKTIYMGTGAIHHTESLEGLPDGWYVARLTNGNSMISKRLVVVSSGK